MSVETEANGSTRLKSDDRQTRLIERDEEYQLVINDSMTVWFDAVETGKTYFWLTSQNERVGMLDIDSDGGSLIREMGLND